MQQLVDVQKCPNDMKSQKKKVQQLEDEINSLEKQKKMATGWRRMSEVSKSWFNQSDGEREERGDGEKNLPDLVWYFKLQMLS